MKISLSGRWIVTGTTASSGDHSIITGRSDLPVASWTRCGQELGMAGLGETPIVEHVLGHRVGDDGGGQSGHDVGDGTADRGYGCRRAGSIRPAGRGGDWNIDGDNRKRGANTAAAVRGVTVAIGASNPRCSARDFRKSGSATR